MGLPEPPEPGAAALPSGTFAGQVVVVTGGGTGLGKAIATEFGRLGARVAIASRKPDHLEAGLAALSDIGADVMAVACDIRDPDQIAKCFDEIEAQWQLPAVLVNNAAANFPVPAEDMSPNAWRTVIDITLNGTFLMSREFARRHLAVGSPGSIINVGASYAGRAARVRSQCRGESRIKNMTETLAVEWGPYGLQINGLVPGLFPHEDMTADILSNLDRTSEKDPCQPACAVGRVRELGWAATFLASPFARFISGHTLVVDGANWQRRHMTMPPVVTIRDQMGRGPSPLAFVRLRRNGMVRLRRTEGPRPRGLSQSVIIRSTTRSTGSSSRRRCTASSGRASSSVARIVVMTAVGMPAIMIEVRAGTPSRPTSAANGHAAVGR